MKSFHQFMLEVNYPEKGSDVEKERWNKINARRQSMSDEDRNARIIGSVGRDKEGNRRYGFKLKDSRKKQATTRAKNLRPIKQKELEDYGKRNLLPDYKNKAKKAMKIERERKKAQRTDAQSKSKQTGKQHDVDHIQGQSNRKKYADRWHKIHPGDASDNRRVIPQADNLKKNSKDTGEKKITRAKAIRLAYDRA